MAGFQPHMDMLPAFEKDNSQRSILKLHMIKCKNNSKQVKLQLPLKICVW